MKYKTGLLGQAGIEKYSLSPFIHGSFFEQCGINGDYFAIGVKPEELENKLIELQKQGFIGLNLTIPHKINVLKYITEIDKTAEKIGAINTILFDKNSGIVGYNTDAYGFIEALNKNILNWRNKNKAIVFGSGGASHAVIYGLQENGIADIIICNRTDNKSLELAKHFNCKFVKWEDRNKVLQDRNLLINTTSAGMNDNSSLDIDLTNIKNNSIIYDIVYSPLITPLLQQAKTLSNKNLIILDGFHMLIYQAAKSFEIWFNQSPEIICKYEHSKS